MASTADGARPAAAAPERPTSSPPPAPPTPDDATWWAPTPTIEAPTAAQLVAPVVDLEHERLRRTGELPVVQVSASPPSVAPPAPRPPETRLEEAEPAEGRPARRARRTRRAEAPAGGQPRLPAGAEAALRSIVEVRPDPRNTIALRDPTSEIRLTSTDRADARRAAEASATDRRSA